MSLSVFKATDQTDALHQEAGLVAPWTTPGPGKEQWKEQGHRYDLHELDVSRPPNLTILVSPPR